MLAITFGFLLFKIFWKDVDYGYDTPTALTLTVAIIFLAAFVDIGILSLLLL